MLPEQVKAFGAVERVVVVSRVIFIDGEGLHARSKEGHRLIDIFCENIRLLLKVACAVVPVTAGAIYHARPVRYDPLVLKDVDLLVKSIVLSVEPLAYFSLILDIQLGDIVLTNHVVWVGETRSPVRGSRSERW